MSDPTNTNTPLPLGIVTRTMEEVMHDSMMPYSEHVILDRALPRVEDGLKPVQRRILYSMHELGVAPDKPHRKSARIVGDCMGKYHPHGDSSIYDAMVRLAQPFSMRHTLVDGHGNFGSIDGDGAAAMRYTEARLDPLALELLRDIDKETVSWSLNFDDSSQEPDTLPGRFPNLLVNGAYGIAVGLATNIPPHNLAEVIDGTIALIDNPRLPLGGVMKYIKGPDFPTGGYCIGTELLKAYETGRGKVTLRAKIHIEGEATDKRAIVIDELPFQVIKSNLLQSVLELREEKKGVLQGISEITDESDRQGMRAVIRIKKEADLDAILEMLFKSTNLSVTYGINMIAIAEGKPKQMGVVEILKYYIEYQQKIIVRRTKYDLAAAKERAHILEGLLTAVKNID
ncbi:MAG: DNA gyrase subunit A, partial [Clostridiales bacterium]|nr:DNA gyrase subunit A [Clostridiales bacterium]